MRYLRIDVVRGLKAIIDEKERQRAESIATMEATNRSIEKHYDETVRPNLIRHLEDLLRYVRSNPKSRLTSNQLLGRTKFGADDEDFDNESGPFSSHYSGWADEFGWSPRDLKDTSRVDNVMGTNTNGEKNLLAVVMSVDEEYITTYAVTQAGFRPHLLSDAIIAARKLDRDDDE